MQRTEPLGLGNPPWGRGLEPAESSCSAGSPLRLDSRGGGSYLLCMLRIVSPRSTLDERPPVGAAVRLRHHPELTGVVIGDALEPDRLRVRWDDNDEITDCFAARLELVRW